MGVKHENGAATFQISSGTKDENGKTIYESVTISEEEYRELCNGRERIYFYRDWLTDLEDFSEDEQNEFIGMIFKYSFDGISPTFDGPDGRYKKLAWKGIQKQIDFMNDQYVTQILTGQRNGKKGGRPPKKRDS